MGICVLGFSMQELGLYNRIWKLGFIDFAIVWTL